jgi:hypothetical protein
MDLQQAAGDFAVFAQYYAIMAYDAIIAHCAIIASTGSRCLVASSHDGHSLCPHSQATVVILGTAVLVYSRSHCREVVLFYLFFYSILAEVILGTVYGCRIAALCVCRAEETLLADPSTGRNSEFARIQDHVCFVTTPTNYIDA